MPARIELRIGEVIEIGGIPVTLAYTKGKEAYIAVGCFDADGFLDTALETRSAATTWRRRFDTGDDKGKDGSNSIPV